MKQCPTCASVFEESSWSCPACDWQAGERDGVLQLLDQAQSTGYDAAYFAPLAALEKGHFWFEARNRIIIHTLRRQFPDMQRFLEIGCGTGFVLQAVRATFPQADLAAGDYFDEGVAIARQRVPSATLYRLDARAMPFVDHFDVVGLFDVVEHIKEDELVLVQMHKAIRPGGGLILTVPQHRFLWSVADQYKQHERRYERHELVQKVQAAGFTVQYTTSFVSVLLPFMLFSRLKQNRAAQMPDRLTELRINPHLNRVFDRALRLETHWLQHISTLPLGGSLLLTASKPA